MTERDILFFSGSTSKTLAVISWPSWTRSSIFFGLCQASSLICTKPSTPPISTKMPCSMMPETWPLTTMPGFSSARRFFMAISSSSRASLRETIMVFLCLSAFMILTLMVLPTERVRVRPMSPERDLGMKASTPKMFTIKPPFTRLVMRPSTSSPDWKASHILSQAFSKSALYLESFTPLVPSAFSTYTRTFSPILGMRSPNSDRGTTPSDLPPMSMKTRSPSTLTTVPSTSSPSLGSCMVSTPSFSRSSGSSSISLRSSSSILFTSFLAPFGSKVPPSRRASDPAGRSGTPPPPPPTVRWVPRRRR